MKLRHDIDDRHDTLVVAKRKPPQGGQKRSPEDVVRSEEAAKTIGAVRDMLGDVHDIWVDIHHGGGSKFVVLPLGSHLVLRHGQGSRLLVKL